MNFLIAGGAGTVGRDLTAALLAKGHKVRVLDKRPGACPGAQYVQGSRYCPDDHARQCFIVASGQRPDA